MGEKGEEQAQGAGDAEQALVGERGRGFQDGRHEQDLVAQQARPAHCGPAACPRLPCSNRGGRDCWRTTGTIRAIDGGELTATSESVAMRRTARVLPLVLLLLVPGRIVRANCTDTDLAAAF